MPHTPKQKRKQVHKRNKTQKAGAGTTGSNICQKDINQLLMGNPPASIGYSDDLGEMWRKTKTKEAAKELDSYSKKGWGNYPGTPPKPECNIL